MLLLQLSNAYKYLLEMRNSLEHLLQIFLLMFLLVRPNRMKKSRDHRQKNTISTSDQSSPSEYNHRDSSHKTQRLLYKYPAS